MSAYRRQVGRDMPYKGSVIRARSCQPCLLAEVDGEILQGFYSDTAGVFIAGCRHVDEKLKAAESKK